MLCSAPGTPGAAFVLWGRLSGRGNRGWKAAPTGQVGESGLGYQAICSGAIQCACRQSLDLIQHASSFAWKGRWMK